MQTVSVPFAVGNRCYGAELRVAAKQGDRILDENFDYFNVPDNGFTVALGAGGIGIMGMSGYSSPDSLLRDARTMRETYANWWEKMFWPPDDWGDMTPDRNEWISGQSARWENASNIIAFVKLVKPQGINSITYGKHGVGGPEGWELVRLHPDWFYARTVQ